jgi:RNA polymerase sigma factor (sigma-70 family)
VRILVSQIDVSRSTWEDAYARSFAQVFRGLVALGARPDEAEDALHDAFVRGLEAGEVSSPAGWLFVVAMRRWRRRRWRDRIFRPLLAPARAIEPAPETRIDLFDALGKLTRRQREVLVARYLVGLSQEETAQVLGIARGTVAATSTQAATALRALMEVRR